MVRQHTAVYSFRDTLLVPSTLSSQTELLFMRSPISVKISKGLESAFLNKKGIPILIDFWPAPNAFGTQFSFLSIVKAMPRCDEHGRGKEGRVGDRQLNFFGQSLF